MKTRKRTLALILLGATLSLAAIGAAQTSLDFRVSTGNGSFSMHSYDGPRYRDDVAYLRSEGIYDDDIPVILYIHDHSRYSVERIATLRGRGATWVQLSGWCDVPLRVSDRHYRDYHGGPPYGNAFGYYKHGRGHDRDRGDRDRGDRDRDHDRRYDRDHDR